MADLPHEQRGGYDDQTNNAEANEERACHAHITVESTLTLQQLMAIERAQNIAATLAMP